MNNNDLNIIGKSTLFTGLSEDELQEALDALHARKKTYYKDEFPLMAGDLTNDFGMVLSGSVLIESNDIWGNHTIINYIGVGDYYAEVFSFLPNEPLYVDVRAGEPTTVALFDMSRLKDLQNDPPPWGIRILHNLLNISIQKNIVLSKRSSHTSPKSARGRIMAYLNSVALKMKRTEFDIPFDRQHMADYLNLDRTDLSNELSRMRDDGIVVVSSCSTDGAYSAKREHETFRFVFAPSGGGHGTRTLRTVAITSFQRSYLQNPP